MNKKGFQASYAGDNFVITDALFLFKLPFA